MYVCTIHVLQLYTSPNINIPGEASPLHISMSPFLCHACARRHAGQVRLFVVAHISCLWFTMCKNGYTPAVKRISQIFEPFAGSELLYAYGLRDFFIPDVSIYVWACGVRAA